MPAPGSATTTEPATVVVSFFGRFAARFWVYGRFVVRDGRIAVWRDSFDWLDVTIGNLRGLAAMAIPALNRRMPTA
jgi:limonene-1,2-epoxide hydrolase